MTNPNLENVIVNLFSRQKWWNKLLWRRKNRFSCILKGFVSTVQKQASHRNVYITSVIWIPLSDWNTHLVIFSVKNLTQVLKVCPPSSHGSASRSSRLSLMGGNVVSVCVKLHSCVNKLLNQRPPSPEHNKRDTRSELQEMMKRDRRSWGIMLSLWNYPENCAQRSNRWDKSTSEDPVWLEDQLQFFADPSAAEKLDSFLGKE